MKIFTILQIIMLLVIISSLPSIASADTFDLEIWENNAGIYYVTVNDGALQACNGTICKIEFENSTSSLQLSNSDMKEIAKQTSIQMALDGFKPTVVNSGVNESTLTAVVSGIIENKQADDRAFITRTWMPEADKMNNLSLLISEKEGALNTLNAQLNGYDATILLKDTTIGTLQREVELYHFIIIMLGIALGLMSFDKFGLVQAIREWREQ